MLLNGISAVCLSQGQDSLRLEAWGVRKEVRDIERESWDLCSCRSYVELRVSLIIKTKGSIAS